MKELTKQTFGETPENFKRRLAYALQQEEKPMKMSRKAWIAIVVSAVLFIAVACTALALVFGNYEKVLELEISKGFFDTWTAEERLALAQMMLDDGLIKPDERTERLLGGGLDEAESMALAAELITETLGAREDTVGYLSIMEAIRGPFDTWTLEQKAEYSELKKKYGLESSESEFYMPLREGDVTEAEAVRIAKAGLEDAHQLPRGTLDAYKARAEFYRMKQGPQEPRWLIELEFNDPKTEPGTEGHSMYTAIVSSAGELVDDHDRGILSPKNQVIWQSAYGALMARKNAEGIKKPMFMWTAEEQAIAFPSSCGLPGPDDVPMEDAVKTAKRRLVSGGLYTEEALAELEICTTFQIRWTDNVKVPFWNISFVRYYPEQERPYDEEMLVFVDGKTGEVVWYRGMAE